VVESEVTDSGVTDGNGFVTCKGKKSHHINFIGNPIYMIGRTFTVKSNRSQMFGYDIRKGKIAEVVRKPGKKSINYFKFYDLMEYPLGPPVVGSSSWCYKECKSMLCTDKRVLCIKWDALGKRVCAPRQRRSTYVMTYSPGNALYDNYPPPVASDKSESEEEYSGSDSGSSESTFTVKHRGHLIDDDNINDGSDDGIESENGEKLYWEENTRESKSSSSSGSSAVPVVNAMTAVLNKKNHMPHQSTNTVGCNASAVPEANYWSDR
jgi:hypothetical protein